MKNWVQSLAIITGLFLGVSPLKATQNIECENENSPFFLEIGADTAFVVNKRSYELEKVLPQVPRKRSKQSVYESKGGDWNLRVARDKSSAQLKIGDSDEIVPFSCSP